MASLLWGNFLLLHSVFDVEDILIVTSKSNSVTNNSHGCLHTTFWYTVDDKYMYVEVACLEITR